MMKVGLLIPFSGLVSSIGQEIEKGLRLGCSGFDIEEVSIVTQYLNCDEIDRNRDALNDLIKAENAQLIIAVLNCDQSELMKAHFEKCGRPVVIFNLAACRDVIKEKKLSNVFLNSLDLSSSQYVLSNFAKDLLDQTCVCLDRVEEKGVGTMSKKLMQHISGDMLGYLYGEEDIQEVLNFAQQHRPRHIHILTASHSIFSKFIKLLKEEKFSKVVKVSFIPYFSDTSTMKVLEVSSRNIFSASTWFKEIDNEANLEFVENYHNNFGSAPEGYALLAYEVGLLLRNSLEEKSGKISKERLLVDLNRVNVLGPRGAIDLHTQRISANPVYVSKVGLGWDGLSLKREIISCEEMV
ncbi:ABC transporter substrate-binding protein [Echinicola sp. CAU 1574]|uniref:ABC transporter substrate-binding protein n=1 Tax=Echinicola arenosa TaxID=2774144 RepID=A0ABR9AJT7_9BACT|nr:ABC transporter substrate-binding protein [Echinicola arenosa]MBD8489090.1 ABC transporter substrate-binding protein [Echinicola arenosa]